MHVEPSSSLSEESLQSLRWVVAVIWLLRMLSAQAEKRWPDAQRGHLNEALPLSFEILYHLHIRNPVFFFFHMALGPSSYIVSLHIGAQHLVSFSL